MPKSGAGDSGRGLFVQALAGIGMRGHPVFGDVEAPCDPHALMLLDVVEQPPQARHTAGMTDQPHVRPTDIIFGAIAPS